jgi:hypothetical protein
VTLRSTLYWTARRLGDLHALEHGRVPQRIIRKTVFRHSFRLASWVCRLLGV